MAANPNVVPAELPLRLEVTSANGRSNLVCSGKLVTSTAAYFKSETKRVIERSSSIVMDLGGLTYMDSAGLGVLVAAYTTAKQADCDFRLLHLTPRIMDLLRLTKLTFLEGSTENLL